MDSSFLAVPCSMCVNRCLLRSSIAGKQCHHPHIACLSTAIDPLWSMLGARKHHMLQISGLESKPSKKAALEQTIEQAVTTCLTKPFTDAASAHNRQALTALAQAWIAYLGSMQAKHSADEDFLIKAAAKLIELLASTSGSKAGAAAPDSGCALGNDLGPGQGEMPHAQAAVLYVLRVAVMEQLSETGQVSVPHTNCVVVPACLVFTAAQLSACSELSVRPFARLPFTECWSAKCDMQAWLACTMQHFGRASMCCQNSCLCWTIVIQAALHG